MLEKAEKWVVLFVINCLLVGSMVSLYVTAYVVTAAYQLTAALTELSALVEK